ncbi:MAG: alpha/beta fold hydrolase [Solirubrobacteraceae bacterium]
MTGREAFTVAVPGGALGGWVSGSGDPVLLLHGGPGMSFSYLDELAAELEPHFRVASYQQRGLEPSTVEGPFTVQQALADAVAVLDFLNCARALVVGHSWGGQLALRLIAAHPERVRGALAVDPLGIVGDGGMAAFEAEMIARTPKAQRDRGRELDERAMAGQGTLEEATESLRIMWPAYFADPDSAPPMPHLRISVDAYSGLIGEITAGSAPVAAALATTDVPYGVLAGAGSPMPWGLAARTSVELSPTAFLQVVPGAGHFPWVEAPGCVSAALQRLSEATA